MWKGQNWGSKLDLSASKMSGFLFNSTISYKKHTLAHGGSHTFNFLWQKDRTHAGSFQPEQGKPQAKSLIPVYLTITTTVIVIITVQAAAY